MCSVVWWACFASQQQQTSSMSLAEEKKLIKEIEQLKTSKKTAAQFMTQEEVRYDMT